MSVFFFVSSSLGGSVSGCYFDIPPSLVLLLRQIFEEYKMRDSYREAVNV